MKSGILSPTSGVSSFGGYQMNDSKLIDDLSKSDMDMDLNKILSESMPKHYKSKSRYSKQKLYETEQSFKKQIWKHAKKILENEENEIKE